MAVPRKPGKPKHTVGPLKTGQRQPTASVLDRLKSSEAARVLAILLDRHTAIRAEAEAIAVTLLAPPAVAEVADDVYRSLIDLSIDELNGRAGQQASGYVSPTEAAWELLEEATEEVVSDMTRRMALGLTDAAETICRGIVIGLCEADGLNPDDILGWAEDFPKDKACRVVTELVRACPTKDRQRIRKRLLTALSDDVPE